MNANQRARIEFYRGQLRQIVNGLEVVSDEETDKSLKLAESNLGQTSYCAEVEDASSRLDAVLKKLEEIDRELEILGTCQH